MKKVNEHPLPSRPAGQPDNVRGTGYDIKLFPEGRSGRQGPFAIPAAAPLPAAGDLDGWINYYVELIGAQLELLNALQWDLDVRPAKAAEMTTALGELADALEVGINSVPAQLVWPLGGLHIFPLLVNIGQMGFKSFTIEAVFFPDPDYRMVVNCDLNFIVKINSQLAPLSSSSSFLAVSSSSA